MEKKCTKCKQTLDYDRFSKDKNKKDGLSNWCKECAKNNSKQYYQMHKEQKLAYQSVYREQNRKCINTKKKEHYNSNRDRINRDRRINYVKYRDDVTYKLNRSMSKSIYNALKDKKSEHHWEDIVNWSIEQLKQHLEQQFTPEMSWDNYGSYWEIDHIIPINMFNYKTEQDKDFKICWSLKNLRPLEKIANKSRPKDGRDISQEIIQNIMNGD